VHGFRVEKQRDMVGALGRTLKSSGWLMDYQNDRHAHHIKISAILETYQMISSIVSCA
jgi:hypothetical protein